MTKAQLIAAGYTEEQADALVKMYQAAIDGNYVPKTTFEAERDKVKALQTDVATRDTQIAELKDFKGTAEQLQTKVTELETANKDAQAKYEADLAQTTLKNAVLLEIKDRVFDTEDVISKLDLTKVSVKDNVVSGLKEQLDTMKTSKPHYFKPEKTDESKSGWLFGKTPADSADNKTDTPDEGKEFGAKLAVARSTNDTSAAKAAEHYFK